jgi:hypothetical protein
MTKAVKALERMHVRSVASDPNFSFYPSARAIADLEHSVREMQKGDEKGGLHGEAIQAFENEQTIFLTQAITYESFLKR